MQSAIRAESTARARLRERVYGETVNTWLLELFTPGARVIDIGCGVGAWGPALRARGARALVGIEISEKAAASATRLYDRVLCSPVEEVELDDLDGPFDTIIAADVIEHLVDPFTELRRWREWCVPGGELVISTPNLRHVRVLGDLAVKGRFDYTEGGGVMDRTHLRWFTEASLVDAIMVAGWHPLSSGRLRAGRSGRMNTLARGVLNGLLARQVQLLARRPVSS